MGKDKGLGVPTIVPEGSEKNGEAREDGWVGGLNRLLKFNSRFGEEVDGE